ncbi:type II toxin-antitoxin system RelE/ParE family toxin [Acinetobacter populi]|jgi:plasmid stabilization system protein ParE|uniref:Plasmid stabilization protein n=1 Tax=Acinetobacter populi TaxID=1582270 RepID=A0A1Z9YZ97_9GAMM|nr:type II toxin-antitoxin system RelE/ParE family toxin [Acinetobacter populi]MCH4249234.1 type II toxin-antitoxin system RelE/ParE family toxin [Acinetobacter populi]OUY07536.1 plasmid stabilization protein [Acinetobacter populi]
MNLYQVRFTIDAENDLLRLYDFLLQQSIDVHLAKQALTNIQQAIQLLEKFPFSCRKAESNNPYLRELLIPFGESGYVALFEIEANLIVTILAVRHQRESDYH